jgi:hypothetical protein
MQNATFRVRHLNSRLQSAPRNPGLFIIVNRAAISLSGNIGKPQACDWKRVAAIFLEDSCERDSRSIHVHNVRVRHNLVVRLAYGDQRLGRSVTYEREAFTPN